VAPVLDADQLRSASHNNLINHLAGPFTGGAIDRTLSISGTGHVEISFEARFGIILAAPLAPLDRSGLKLTARLDGVNQDLPPLRFAPYTEAGAFLHLFQPPVVSPLSGISNPFGFTITLEAIAEDATPTPIAPADVAKTIDIRLLEGNLGRLLYLLGAEKQRIRSQSRELSAMRLLSRAHGDALDRYGADLAVPRFADRLRFDAAKKEIVTDTLMDANGNPIAEPDAAYRRRLTLYRPFLIPNRKNVLGMLNGAGGDADPNSGLLGGLGVKARFELHEEPNEFAVALRLISSPDDQARLNFISFIRTDYLIFPNDAPVGNGNHEHRFVSSNKRTEIENLRRELRTQFAFGDDMALAPMLAASLRTVGRVLHALGLQQQVTVKRAQSTNDGSRYELGLGVDIAPLSPQQLDDLGAKAKDLARPKATDPQNPTEIDEATESLIVSMHPKPSADDLDGNWLFERCGLRTVHRVDGNTLYLSHFPTFGLVIETSVPPAGTSAIPMAARYEAPGDPTINAALETALNSALASWAAAGEEPLTLLSDAAARPLWTQPFGAVPQAVLTILQAAGLPAIGDKATVLSQLQALPPELVRTLRLGPNLTQQIFVGQAQAADVLSRLREMLRVRGIVSVLPLITGLNEVLLIVSVIGLPGAGINLSDRRATGFRWYVVPIEGPGGTIKTIGSRTTYVSNGRTINAIVCVGYARRGLVDPYELRIELPDGENLNLLQYEFLMNLLERVYPIGVEVNTFSIRKDHVDLNEDGASEPLPPSISKTYRRFHRPRHRGESAVGLEPNQEGA
jgi:hypothetical protein